MSMKQLGTCEFRTYTGEIATHALIPHAEDLDCANWKPGAPYEAPKPELVDEDDGDFIDAKTHDRVLDALDRANRTIAELRAQIEGKGRS